MDAEDIGAATPEMKVPGITLVFRRSETQEAALKDLLAAQQNADSPLFHRWLTPEEFASRFGAADEDIAATEQWLTSQGFHVDSVARSRDRVTFSGTAAQVQAAFGAELHRFRSQGEIHFAAAADLSLPAELAPVTAAVLHLSDFRPKPNVSVREIVEPKFTASSTQQHYLTPKDIATMYNVNPTHLSGVGQGLAVVGQSYVDVNFYGAISPFQGNLTSASTITLVLVPNSGVEIVSPGDMGESEIDLEYASGTAIGAKVFLVFVGANQNYDVFDALAFTITEDIAPVISVSYGACELAMSQRALEQANALFEQAAAQGQTIVVASGDLGSTTCANYPSSTGLTTEQRQSLAVSFPASSPYVTAVGGTQMEAATFAAGSSAYWQTASNADATSSLLSYVPEVVWNEGSASHGIAASGGGASVYYTRPAWQSGVPGIPGGTNRLVPDIALQSSFASPGFLICTKDPYLMGSQGQSSSCSNGLKGSNGQYTVAGGTSFAAPIFAGFVAMLNQAQNATGGQGNINPVLYKLAANPATYASAFHDIISGTNACVSAASGCSTAGQSNYAATAGYDEATGLGSVDLNALAAAWPSGPAASLRGTRLSINPAMTQPAPGQTVAVQISVQNADPSVSDPNLIKGTLSFSVDGAVAGVPVTVQPTSATTYNFIAPATAGSHLLKVTYSGDATHAPATQTISFMVGSVVPAGTISLSAGNIAVSNGSTATTQVTITPAGGYSGRVFWSLSMSGTPSVSACYSLSPLLVNGASTAQLKIGVGSACSTAVASDRTAIQQAARGEIPVHRDNRSAAAVYAGLVLCGVAARRRRLFRGSLLGVAIFTVVGVALTGCGGGGSSGGGNEQINNSPPPATYTVTLRANDSVVSSITASTTFTLTVN